MITLCERQTSRGHHRQRTVGWRSIQLTVASLLTYGALSVSGPGGYAVTDPTPAPPGVAVASYFFDSALWTQMAGAKTPVGMALINVDSGPGAQRYDYVASAVSVANTAKVPLAGYVATGYGTRNVQAVLADVQKYRTYYQISNVFLDETPYQCDMVPYYEQIFNAVKAVGGSVILNPGMNPYECYTTVSDVIINFEGSSATYAGWSPAPWTANYPASRFWHVIYESDASRAANDRTLAASRRAGWVYITDDTRPNPWDTLPSATVWNILTGNTTSPTTTPTTTAPTSTVTTTTTIGTAVSTSGSTTPTTTAPTVRRSAPSAVAASIGQRLQAPSAAPQPPAIPLPGEVIQLLSSNYAPDAPTAPDAGFVNGVLVLQPNRTPAS